MTVDRPRWPLVVSFCLWRAAAHATAFHDGMVWTDPFEIPLQLARRIATAAEPRTLAQGNAKRLDLSAHGAHSLIVAGDACLGPRIESAWLSGAAAAGLLLRQHSASLNCGDDRE